MAKKVPETVKKVHGEDVSPEEIGPPNAEAKGVWRVLRNSLILAAVILAVIFVGYLAF